MFKVKSPLSYSIVTNYFRLNRLLRIIVCPYRTSGDGRLSHPFADLDALLTLFIAISEPNYNSSTLLLDPCSSHIGPIFSS